MFSSLGWLWLAYEKRKSKMAQKAQSNSGSWRQRLNLPAISAPKPTTSIFKRLLLKVLVGILTALELFPIFFSLLWLFIVGVAVITVSVTILAVTTFLSSVVDDIKDFVQPTIASAVSHIGKLEWSESELASRGQLLSEREKNWYRLVMLFNEHIGKQNLSYPPGSNTDMSLRFAVGIASTESGGEFYNQGNTTKNILKTPTDKSQINSSGFTGSFGLHHTVLLENYFGDQYASYLRRKYLPDFYSKNPTTDSLFIPWASAVSIKHLHGKIAEQNITRQSTFDTAERLMNSFGIHANREEVKAFLIWALATAQYHGASASEWEGYMAFLCAVYASTSDNDALRSFDKITLVSNGYSESTVRQLVLGSTPFQLIDRYTYASQLPPANTTAYLLIDGKRLTQPLWAYVYNRFGHKQELRDAWQLAVKFAAAADDTTVGYGYVARVLNFHYGLNSYIQGNRIVKMLTDKMIGFGYEVSPGKGQGAWNNANIEAYIARFPNNKDKALAMQPYWGTSTYTKPRNIGQTPWQPDKWGAPFYRQGAGDEDYSNVVWGASGSTFDVDGCMIYSYAYAASALTGKLINPPEMASAMYVNGALVNAGVIISAMKPVFADLGLKYETVRLSDKVGIHTTGEPFDKVWQQIDSTLDAGGLAIVMGGKHWANGPNHFFVISEKKESSGKFLYRVYTSSSVKQTMTWWDKSAFEGSLHSVVALVTKTR